MSHIVQTTVASTWLCDRILTHRIIWLFWSVLFDLCPRFVGCGCVNNGIVPGKYGEVNGIWSNSRFVYVVISFCHYVTVGNVYFSNNNTKSVTTLLFFLYTQSPENTTSEFIKIAKFISLALSFVSLSTCYVLLLCR